MRIIDHLAREIPDLDAVKMQLLLTLKQHPDFCVRELADCLCIAEKSAQFHVKQMTEPGRKGRERSALGLLICKRDAYDHRRYEIKLTAKGRKVVRLLKPLIVEIDNE